ncbi:MAG: hypothetical protein K2O45_10420 [Oscillospiraceae bacterium]|nr:hypothetical protein [Oscillospiraceae bacterium]
MKLYHVSPVPGLTILRPSVSEYFGKPKQVCLTALKPMALLYGIRHFEYTYGYTGERELYYEEYFPGALEELYRGKAASLYHCAWREGMETTRIPNEYVSADEVPVEEEILIPDVYEALLEEERLGTMRIVRWPDVPEKSRRWIVNAEMEVILENKLLGTDTAMARYMREKYPESWAMAQEEDEK